MKSLALLALAATALSTQAAFPPPPGPDGVVFNVQKAVAYAPKDPRFVAKVGGNGFLPAADVPPSNLPEMAILKEPGATYAAVFQVANTAAQIDYTTESINSGWQITGTWPCYPADQWVFVGHFEPDPFPLKFFRGALTPCSPPTGGFMPAAAAPPQGVATTKRLKVKGKSYRLYELPGGTATVKLYRGVR